MVQEIRLSRHIPDELAGQRLDQALASVFSEYSRARLQQWIRDGQVRVDAQHWRAKDKVHGGERVDIDARVEAQEEWQPEALPLDIVFEDEALLVIDKPAGLVVHPAAGNRAGTLLNALLHHAPELAHIPRAGIVHRLDKDTSGLLVVARTLTAQKSLVAQLQARSVSRQYECVVVGVLTAGGTVDAPIGRHSVQRKRMAVVTGGKPAVTHFRVIDRFRAHTHLGVRLETGRTHQIRVHMAHLHHPLVGDPVYGGRLKVPAGASEQLTTCLRGFRRQALHAAHLGLIHPLSGEPMGWDSPLPADMRELLQTLRDDMTAKAHETDRGVG